MWNEKRGGTKSTTLVSIFFNIWSEDRSPQNCRSRGKQFLRFLPNEEANRIRYENLRLLWKIKWNQSWTAAAAIGYGGPNALHKRVIFAVFRVIAVQKNNCCVRQSSRSICNICFRPIDEFGANIQAHTHTHTYFKNNRNCDYKEPAARES